MGVARGYFAASTLVFVTCMSIFAAFVVNWASPLSLIQFGLLIFFTFSFSMTFTTRLFSVFIPPFPLPKLGSLERNPKVAILYTSMNDVVPQCLEGIAQTHPVDVYVLDDSSDMEKWRAVDRISQQRGYTVVHRDARTGYKAGAINNWLKKYGSQYDYFLLLDADSLIPRDWVEHCLLYAEDQANRNIAIFQGLVNIWNLEGRFTEALAPIHVISQDEWEKKMANYLDAVIFYGHNALLRVRPVLEVGGFPTDYVSEDFALAVRLADHGYHSRFVPLHTYEALPTNVRGFVKRQNKWTRGAMEFFGFVKNSKITWGRKLVLLQVPMGHVSYLCIMAAMFVAVYARNSTWSAAFGFAQGLLASPLVFIISIPLFRYTLGLGAVSALLVGLKLFQVKLHPTLYWRFQLVSRSIGAIMLPHEVKSILYYLFNRTKRFPVTPKDEQALAWRDVARVGWLTILLTITFVVGFESVNPIGFFYNIAWLGPFATAPLVIYYFSKPSHNHDPELNIGPFLVTCLQSNGGRPLQHGSLPDKILTPSRSQ